MHAFVREHIVRGYWKKKERPILINSWEAMYFDVREKKVLKLAKEAAKAGIELFVLDDGLEREILTKKRLATGMTIPKSFQVGLPDFPRGFMPWA